MKLKPQIYLVVVLGVLAILACGAPANLAEKYLEKGDITFVNPAPDGTSVFHEYDVQTLPVTVTINSSFEDAKNATLGVDGVYYWNCGLEGLGRDTTCPVVQIQGPGVHTLTAQVQKRDGSMVNIQTTFTWTPWSPVEQKMSSLAGVFGQKDPKWGFNILGFGLALAVTCFLLYVTKGSKFGTIAITVVMVITFFILAPVEITSLFIESAGGIVTFYILYMIFTSLHFFRIHRGADGSTSMTYLGQGGEGGGRITDSVGRTAVRVLPPPPPQPYYYPPQLIDPDDYEDQNGIRHTTVRPTGFFGRLLGGGRR